MISPEYLLTAFVVVLIPGTGVMFAVSTGLLLGWRAALWAAVGCTAGILPHLAASALGLAALLHLSALAFNAIKLAGAAYMLYLAWSMWRARGGFDPGAPGGIVGGPRIALRAFLMNILNPKLTLFFFAFLPQFMRADGPSPLIQLVTLGGVFMVMTFAVFVAYGVVASLARSAVLAAPRRLVWLQRGFAVVFAWLGLRLVLADR